MQKFSVSVIMSTSEDEDVLALVQVVNIVNRNRRYWVHPMWKRRRNKKGTFEIMKELEMYPEKFQSFYRMTKRTFFLFWMK